MVEPRAVWFPKHGGTVSTVTYLMGATMLPATPSPVSDIKDYWKREQWGQISELGLLVPVFIVLITTITANIPRKGFLA